VARSSGASHEEVARNLRRPINVDTSERALLLRELVRYSTLAPSSHNTRCWKFHVKEASITIEPDLLRRCPIVDPDDHQMFVSLGCATENLAHAALANGLQTNANFDAAGTGAVSVSLEATKALASPLFKAIAERQCSRSDYDGKPLSLQELRALDQAGRGNGVRVVLLTDRLAMEKVLDYVVAGNTAQMADPAFVVELKSWIRFSDSEAVRTGDGLFPGSSGKPAMPRWLGSHVMDLFFTPKSERERYARQSATRQGLQFSFPTRATRRIGWRLDAAMGASHCKRPRWGSAMRSSISRSRSLRSDPVRGGTWLG
jgi:hypothetical protein